MVKLNVFIHKHLPLTHYILISIFLSIRKPVVKFLLCFDINSVNTNTDSPETNHNEKLAGKTFSMLEN